MTSIRHVTGKSLLHTANATHENFRSVV